MNFNYFIKYAEWVSAPLYHSHEIKYTQRWNKYYVSLKFLLSIATSFLAVLIIRIKRWKYLNVLIFSDWGTTELFSRTVSNYLHSNVSKKTSYLHGLHASLTLYAILPRLIFNILKGLEVQINQYKIKQIVWSYVRAYSILNCQVDGIVVFTQHSITSRALLFFSLRQDIKIIYLPHAPTVNSILYEDLPAHIAGLWGHADLSIYRKLSLSGNIKIVGNPTLERRQLKITSDWKYIYAPSPLPENELINQIEILNSIGIKQLSICLHPRMKIEKYRRFFEDKIHSELIFIGLRLSQYSQCGDVVISSSSGVSLDALINYSIAVDLPVTTKNLDYHYLNDNLIIKLSKSTSLEEFENKILKIRSDIKAYVVDVDHFVNQWISYFGGDSLERIKEIIKNIKLHKTNVIYDRWNAF